MDLAAPVAPVIAAEPGVRMQRQGAIETLLRDIRAALNTDVAPNKE